MYISEKARPCRFLSLTPDDGRTASIDVMRYSYLLFDVMRYSYLFSSFLERDSEF